MIYFKREKAQSEEVTRTQKGAQYEDLALQFLLGRGLTLITRNYRCKCGELDLIMTDKGAIVIVEVRYRKNNRYGSALESVTKTKQARVIAATKHYIVTQKIDQPIRFDVVAITGNSLPDWVKNAF